MSLTNSIYDFEQISDNKLFTLKNKIEISIKAASKINEFHKENLYFKNLTSQSFIYDLTKDDVVLNDFNEKIKQTKTKGNRLFYISPEQTGRINRTTDYRTDIYSFGVVLFKLFTKTYPFAYDDPIQIIHSHIAKIPTSVSNINSYVPVSLSKIIEKLLKKEPEERYQSLSGICYDLKKVLQNLDENNNDEFTLATKDISHRPNVPHTLYGRKKEENELKDIFYDVLENGKKQLVTVSGYSGIGKSVLVQSLYKNAIKENIYFLNSKFEQYTQTKPYYGLTIAIQDYINHILLSSEQKLNEFKKYILTNLGDNVKLLCEIIPNLEPIIGDIKAPVKLNPKETQNRFNLTFLSFIKLICNFEDCLIISLDDIQWADSATLNMIQQVLEDKYINNLMLILSYRNNEVSSKHLFNLMMKELKYTSFKHNQISLEPLNNEHISEIVQDTFNVNKTKSQDLVDLIENKTSGNPFFIKEFLYNLYDEQLLDFDNITNSWSWDIEKIKAKNITDNVADLMIQKIDNLSSFSKEIIQYFSCLNKTSNIDLADILNIEDEKIYKAFQECLEEGLILHIGHDNEYKLGYKFSHDKVQEAVYLKFEDKKKKEFHLKIGKYLLDSYNDDYIEKNIFDIVEHLNISSDLIKDNIQIEQLAYFNYVAATKAKNSNAYDSSINYLYKTIDLLGEDSWSNNYSFTLDIYSLLCEAYYLNLDFENAHNNFESTLNKCAKINDKIKISQIQIYSLTAQNKMAEALELGLDIINEFGMQLPKEDDISKYYPKLFKLYDENKISELSNLPVLKDQNKLDILDILNSIMAPAYLSAPHIYPKICFLAVKLCIQNGNCKASANVYAVHSLLLCGFFEQYKNGYDFAKLALNIVEDYDARIYASKVEMISNACVIHWNKHIPNSLEGLKQSVLSGLDCGDFEYACYSAMYYCLYSILSGNDCKELISQTNKYASLMKDLKQDYQIHYTSIWQQFLFNIHKGSKNNILLEGEAFSEKNSLVHLIQSNNISTLYCFYLAKSILCLYYNNIEEAYKNINEAKKYHMGVISLFHFNEFYLYEAIITYKFFKQEQSIDKKNVLDILTTNLTYYKKQALTSSQNNTHKVFIIKAMIKHLKNNNKKAWFYFDNAIKESKENSFTQICAIYNDLFAQYWIENDKDSFAKIHINNTYESYKEFKALNVASAYYTRNKEYFDEQQGVDLNKNQNLEAFNFKSIDLNSVIKASLAISEEISLENLLDKTMNIIIENSGSQIGALLLENNGNLEVEISFNLNDKNCKFNCTKQLPQTVINYVKRTKQYVLFNLKESNDYFDADEYILKNKPKSILCLPLLYKKEFMGILYLENKDINNLYTQEKISLLHVLSNQAAISIDHAKLFKQTVDNSKILEKTVKEKTKELQKAVEDLRVFATIDSMTGLNNRRYFFELGSQMFEDARKNEKNLCALLFDIDKFKSINDTYGHIVGDIAIKFFAKALKNSSSEYTIAGRLGGDEFVFLIYDKDKSYVEYLIESIKQNISILNIKEHNLVLPMSTSIGCAYLKSTTLSLDELILEADYNMYEEKNEKHCLLRSRS